MTSLVKELEAICACPSEQFHRDIPMTIRETDSEIPNYEHHRPARLQEEIRHRAYQIWEERGRPEGEALHDWLRAEQEILSHEVMGETGVEENRLRR